MLVLTSLRCVEATEAQKVSSLTKVTQLGKVAERGSGPGPVFLYHPRSCLSMSTWALRQDFRMAPEFSMPFDPVPTVLWSSL